MLECYDQYDARTTTNFNEQPLESKQYLYECISPLTPIWKSNITLRLNYS